MKYYTLKVMDIHPETKDCVTVLFKQPALKRVKYLAGQYLSLIFQINGRRYVRPYSFSSAPGVESTLNITVKRVSGGIISNHIIDKLKIDDLVEVMEPMGNFTLEDNNFNDNKQIYLWGAGSGITPLISIAKYALYHHQASFITLVYGNRNYESVIFRDEIEILKEKFSEQFTAQHFITSPFTDKLSPNIVQGRITAEKVRNIFSKRKTSTDQTYHYICGPIGLKESVKSVLKELGINHNNICSEDFEIKRNPKDFENIYTQYVSIKKSGEYNSIEVVAGKSILEAGLDSLIKLSYSCQTGNCLVCRGRIVKGEVKMIGIEKLPESLDINECLLCCSFPVSDNLEIEVD
jgi:ring-1,2-phenylacetyl-CoA epoxidase subunit PaaE